MQKQVPTVTNGLSAAGDDSDGWLVGSKLGTLQTVHHCSTPIGDTWAAHMGGR